MKSYETKTTTETITRKSLIRRSCDLCGKEAKNDEWAAGIYEVNETEIEILVRQKEGVNYPEGGSGTSYEIDLCPDCFKNRLVPWLKSQGASIEEQEWDY